MLSINLDDVVSVLTSIRPYLIAIAIIVVVGIIIKVAFRKKEQPAKRRIGALSTVGILAGICICVNLILTGPMSTMMDLVSGSGTIEESTSNEARALAMEIAEEGIMLLENDGILPLAPGAKLNVFGWSSTNPMWAAAVPAD